MNGIISTNNLISNPRDVSPSGGMTETRGGASMKNIISGIYSIENIVNGNRYIGSAVNISQRWHDHKKVLRKGTHHSRHLQNAWNKYGESAFVFSVLRVIESKDDLIRSEQEFIDALNPEYNICRTAGNTLGFQQPDHVRKAVAKANSERVITDEYRCKMSQSTKGKVVSDETKKNISLGRRLWFLLGGKNKNEVKIYQYSIDGKFIDSYDSIAEAAQVLGLKGTHISRCARGKRKTVGGFIWKYAQRGQ